MPAPLFFLILAVGIFLFIFTLECIRRGRLREEFSLIWLLSAAILIILPFFKNSLRSFADLLGIEYPPSLIFLVSIILLAVMLINHSITLSSLSSHDRDLAQKLAILESDLANLQTLISKHENITRDALPMRNLLKVGSELQKYLNLPDVLQHTLEVATECVGGRSGSLMVFDKDGHLVQDIVVYEGKSRERDPLELVDTVEKGLAGWVISTHSPALVVNTHEDPRWIKRPWDEKPGTPRSAISVPLETNSHVAGVLTVASPQKGHFTEMDMLFLRDVAAIISKMSDDILNHSQDWVENPKIIDGSVVASAFDKATVDQR